MLKNALFFGKSWKNRPALEAPPTKPCWPPVARPPSCYSQLNEVLLLRTVKIFRHH